jgi:long-chain acyl-CoA synthetase
MPAPDPDQPAVAPGAWVLAASEPERPALIVPGADPVSYGSLAAAANRVSNALRDLGAGPGDVVASLQHNGPRHFEVLLATSQLGVYFVPVNVHLAPAEIAYIVADSGAKMLIASSDLARSLAEVPGSLPERRYVTGEPVPGWAAYEDLTAGASDALPPARVNGWWMGYTSGTTGRPKGVKRPVLELEPEMVIAAGTGYLGGFGLVPGPGVHLVCSPLYHAAPCHFSMQALHLGHAVVIHRKFDAEAVLADIERYQVTSTQMVPTHLHRMLRLPAETRGKYDLRSIQVMLVAGAPFPPEEKRAAIEWLGPVVWEYLAATEGMVCRVSPAEALEHPGTVGRPDAVKLLAEDGTEVPHGEVGTIYFPTQLPFEYLNDPAKTGAAVRPDGWATVGDIGRLDEDGYLYLLDRRVDLIISGGVNIYPAEIEQRLITHPAVADVAVVGVPHPDWGHQPVAVVQLEDGAAGGPDLAATLDAHCRDGLASLKCPARYEFREALPRTASGKLLRRLLREELAAREAQETRQPDLNI